MPVLKLNNIGDNGLNSDQAPWELPPEFITSGNNFRTRFGAITPFNGSSLLLPPSGASEVGFLTKTRNKNNEFWVQASRNQVFAASVRVGTWIDISAKDYSLPEEYQHRWTSAQLGQILVMNNISAYPEYYTGFEGEKLVGLPFKYVVNEEGDTVPFTWEESNLHCKAMRSHKNFLIAMNLSGSDTGPNTYRISHPADANGIPFTWDEQDRSAIAVKAQLGSDGGEIVDGLTMRDYFYMYSRDSIDVLYFNASSEFYWERKEVSSTTGLLNSNCIVEVKGTHYFIADGDIMRNDGNDITSILYGKLLRRFNSRLNEHTQTHSYVARNDLLKEVWFCVPEDTSITASIAYVYNWKENSWNIRDLPAETAFIDYGSVIAKPGTITDDTWNIAKGLWSTQTLTWDLRKTDSLQEVLSSVNVDGSLYNIDPKGDINEDAFNCIAERTNFPLLDNIGTVTVVSAYPTAEGDSFYMQFGSQQMAGGPVEWGAELEFTPGVDRKLDFRTTGEMFCYRILSKGKNRFRISGMELTYTPAGRR